MHYDERAGRTWQDHWTRKRRDAGGLSDEEGQYYALARGELVEVDEDGDDE